MSVVGCQLSVAIDYREFVYIAILKVQKSMNYPTLTLPLSRGGDKILYIFWTRVIERLRERLQQKRVGNRLQGICIYSNPQSSEVNELPHPNPPLIKGRGQDSLYILDESYRTVTGKITTKTRWQ